MWASCRKDIKSLLDLDLPPVQNPEQPLSALCRKGLLDFDLQTVQSPQPPIVSIMQKTPHGPWLTLCSKPTQFHCQHHAEKAFWTLTYVLFKTQTITLSAWCRKGLLDSDSPSVKNPHNALSAWCRKGFLDPNLQTVQTQQFYCQYHVEKTSWTLTYNLFETKNNSIFSILQKRLPKPWLTLCSKPNNFIVSIMQKMPPELWLTICPKAKQFHGQHHAENASWTLTYSLFKTQLIT